jgi:hypothetical protein
MLTKSQIQIVITDDTPPFSSFYKAILEDKGFLDVNDFVDPKIVLCPAEKGELRPDIVVSDFNMGSGKNIKNCLIVLFSFYRLEYYLCVFFWCLFECVNYQIIVAPSMNSVL